MGSQAEELSLVTPNRMRSQTLESQFVMPTHIALFIKLVQLMMNLVCKACTTVDVFWFNLNEFGYWGVVLCIYSCTLTNFYCIGQLHLAEIP